MHSPLGSAARQLPTSPVSRRQFLAAGTALGTFALLPAQLRGADAPSNRLTLAGIGVGGVGFGQLQDCEKAGFEIVALCDVDQVYAQKAFDRWPKARRYRDHREMLDAERGVDAVYVGTPDHTHALIAMEALRRKKHVCCVKPLTRTLSECRAVVDAARQAGVATQVTAAPNTDDPSCRTAELIQAGGLGAIREVHVWSNRPVWPQGMFRPTGADPVPPTLDWERWIGPAPMRPFKSEWPDGNYARSQIKAQESWISGYRGVYHPFNFRGWWDFGTGALGDMGCHHLNPIYRALRLTHPTRINATATRVTEETAPLASVVTYDYPEIAGRPAVRLVWYDGGLRPPAPVELGVAPLPAEGALYLGDEGKLLVAWDRLQILPESRANVWDSVARTLPRRGGTWAEWFDACRGGEKAGCDFDWAGLLTEAVLLGNVAIRTEQPIEWDAQNLRVTNVPEANRYVHHEYRTGWSL